MNIKRPYQSILRQGLCSLVLLGAGLSLQAADRIVTTVDNTAASGSLIQAITALQDGDVIKFNIPGAGPHVIVTPLGGYPLITANNVFIDGYSQPGSVPNSNGILGGNNAQLKIVLDSSGDDFLPSPDPLNEALVIRRSTRLPFSGYGDSENAILGVNEADGFRVRGLSFIGRYVAGIDADPAVYAVALIKEAKNAKVQGCWFGLMPGAEFTQENIKPVTDAVAAFRWRDSANQNPVYSGGLTVGTDGDGVNDIQEFNVVVGAGCAICVEAPDLRVSGNYVNVFPDGLTFVNVEGVLESYLAVPDADRSTVEFMENGRVTTNTIIGTNGDGKSDGNERNIVAHPAYDHDIEFYSDASNAIIAGNYFGVGVDGVTTQPALVSRAPNLIELPGSNAQIRIGSNGDGVSDDIEGNVIVGVLGGTFVKTGVTTPITARRNKMINNAFAGFPFADGQDGRGYDVYYAEALVDPASGVLPIITAVTAGTMTGTVPAPNIANFAKHVVDVYVVDSKAAELGLNLPGKYAGSFTEGGGGDTDPAANTFSVDLRGMKIVPGDAIALAITYTKATSGTPGTNSRTGPLSAPFVATDIPVVVPGSVESIGLTRIVPDKAIIVPDNDALGNWEPNASVLGASTFLIEGNTFADGTTDKQRYVVALQPAAGAAGKTVEGFYDDSNNPFNGPINASRQNGNPGRVAGDKRPGALAYVVGGEASPHTLTEFSSGDRWNTGYDRTTSGGASSRYATVQAFTLNAATLTPTPTSKAIDSANGRATTGQVASDQNSRFGGDIAFLSNGNYVSLVEDRSRLLNASGNAAVATILKPDGSIVKESFLVANGDQWANLAAYKGGFAVRNGSTFYLYDNDGNATGAFSQTTSGISFNSGRGDATRIAGHINSPYIAIIGKATDATVVKVAAWDTRDPQRFATFDVSEPAFIGNVDRANIAIDALNRITASWVSSPDGYELPQVAARVLALNGDSMQITALTSSFFPFINAAKTGDITSVGMTIAMTTKQICVAAKGSINLENNPGNGASINANTGGPLKEVNFYTVFSHPAPAEDPTPSANATTPTLSIQDNSNNTITITWTGALQSSDTVGGTYTTVTGIGPSPATIPSAGAAKFYRASN